MKLKSTVDGLKAKPVNPFKQYGDAMATEYMDFEANNPELPLTKQMPCNTVLEGVEVWQYFKCGKWITDKDAMNTFASFNEYKLHSFAEPRLSYEPEEQVREEAPKTADEKFWNNLAGACNDEDDNRSPHEEYLDAIIANRKASGEFEDDCVTPKASNPELGVEEPKVKVFTYDLSAYQFFRENSGDRFDGNVYYKGTIDDVVALMENYHKQQATQQQGWVRLESVIGLLREWDAQENITVAVNINTVIDKLKTLKQ